MRLAALLAELSQDQLDRLRAEHLGDDEHVTRASLAVTLEGVLRSYAFVRKFVGDRFPPTFSILEALLDADGYSLPASSFRDVVTERTNRLTERVRHGELVGRDNSIRLYRRVLLEARRNDLVLDASETAILSVLRRELEIRSVEHFLIEHHPDFHEFWATEDAFIDQMHALRSCGLVFGHQGNIVLADEVVPLIRQTLGLEMPLPKRRRLFGHLTSQDLSEILGFCGIKTGGSREDRLERLLADYIQPAEALTPLSSQTLKELCRVCNASVSGSKEEIIERLVEHVLHDQDIRPESVPAPATAREPEPRGLDATRFKALFTALRHDDLTDILTGIDSPSRSGGKDRKVDLLIRSPFSETTLLEKLTSKALEENLTRHHLRPGGSKHERIDRIVDHYRVLPEAMLAAEAAPPSVMFQRPTTVKPDADTTGSDSGSSVPE